MYAERDDRRHAGNYRGGTAVCRHSGGGSRIMAILPFRLAASGCGHQADGAAGSHANGWRHKQPKLHDVFANYIGFYRHMPWYLTSAFASFLLSVNLS